jgi:hypothetical protein
MERFYLELIIFVALVGGIAITASVLAKHETKTPEPVVAVAQAQEPATPVDEPAPEPPKYDCWNGRMKVIATDEVRRKYADRALANYNKSTREDADYVYEKELTAGDEYLAHPECTEQRDEISRVITGLHEVQQKWGKRS